MSNHNPESTADRSGLVALVRHRAYALVVGGQLISQLGNSAFRVGLAFASLELVPSGRLLPNVFLAQGLGLIVAVLAGGVIVDRRSSRVVVLGSDLLRFAIVAALVILFVGHAAKPWHLVVFGLLFGIVDGTFQPAFGAAMPELVPANLISRANAIKSVGMRIVTLVGAPLGGLLSLSNATSAFALNSISFLLAGVGLLLGGRWPYPHQRRAARKHILSELGTGIAFVWRARWLSALIAVCCVGIVFVFAGAFTLLPIVLSKRPHGPVTLGLVLMASAIGGIIAGSFLARSPDLRRPGTVFLISLFATSGAYAFVVLSNSTGVALVFALAAGAGTAIGSIVYSTILQRLVPREVLGRVNSIDLLGSYALLPVANAVIAALLGVVPADRLYLWSCAIGCVIAAVAMAYAPIRDIRMPIVDRTPPAVEPVKAPAPEGAAVEL
ncbi:MAG: MFS transporter [Hamadaea sp.]|uniref:MFS transporter n=1 Tax=Hamadaea sp. TaxID=2024425 RepID=UPI0017B3D690|nr:MFS transporter [Hamadaea sp.]NUT24205.1 MFS transporter [Hamadaea sp.]